MEAVVWIVVVGIILVIVFVVVRGVMGMVVGGAEIGILVKTGRELKDPDLPAERLRWIADVVGRSEPDLLPQIAAHPSMYPALRAWITEFRETLASRNVNSISNFRKAPSADDSAG
jgi:hypothetical protein